MVRLQVSNGRYRWGCGARIRTGRFIPRSLRFPAAVSVGVCWRRSRDWGRYAADRNVGFAP